tara:strand:+ start:777 stop:1004 length:228 start_codon:yes stop_codon:yes gene_type:complete
VENQIISDKKITLTEIIEQLNIWIGDAQFDISGDNLDKLEKMEMQNQIQQMLIAKANLETIENFGNKIFDMSIRR